MYGFSTNNKRIGYSAKNQTQQAANVARFAKSLPKGNTGIAIDSLGEGIVASSTVPGRVAGSSAVYQKAIGANGNTTGFLKTTFKPNGEIVHIKDKLSETIIDHDR